VYTLAARDRENCADAGKKRSNRKYDACAAPRVINSLEFLSRRVPNKKSSALILFDLANIKSACIDRILQKFLVNIYKGILDI